MNVIKSEIARDPEYNKSFGNDKAIARSIARNKAKVDPSAKSARKAAAKAEAPQRKKDAELRKKIQVIRKVVDKADAGSEKAKKALSRYSENIGAKSTLGQGVYGSKIDSADTVTRQRGEFKKNALASAERAKKNYRYYSDDTSGASAKSIARNERKKAKKAKAEARNQVKVASMLKQKLEPKFGAQSANIAKNQAILKSKSSTPDDRAKAKRLITINARNSKR